MWVLLRLYDIQEYVNINNVLFSIIMHLKKRKKISWSEAKKKL